MTKGTLWRVGGIVVYCVAFQSMVNLALSDHDYAAGAVFIAGLMVIGAWAALTGRL